MNTLETVKRSAPPAVFPEPPVAAAPVAALPFDIPPFETPPLGPSPIVAHQGGWDEILMVVAPLAIIGGLLWLANRRVTAQLEGELPADERADGAESPAVDNADEAPRSSGGDGQD